MPDQADYTFRGTYQDVMWCSLYCPLVTTVIKKHIYFKLHLYFWVWTPVYSVLCFSLGWTFSLFQLNLHLVLFAPQLSRVITVLDITLSQPQHNHHTNCRGAQTEGFSLIGFMFVILKIFFFSPLLRSIEDFWFLLWQTTSKPREMKRRSDRKKGIWRAEIRTRRCPVQILGAAA